jgi:outer membrane protein TolC
MCTPPYRAALLAGAAALTFGLAPGRAAGAQPPAPRPTARPAAAAAPAADSLPLALPAAVARALDVGDEVRLAAAQVEATESQITVARATGLPQLRVNGGYTQVLENARANIVGSLFAQNYNYNANTNLSQPLFLGGRVRAGLRAARSARAAGLADAAEVRAQVTVDVQRAYLNAQAADRLVAIQDSNLAVSDARVRQLEQLERGGRAARFDVLRARVERANLEPLAVQARNDRELAYVELKRLLNLPAERPLRLTTQLAGDSASVARVLARAAADSAGAADRAPGARALVRAAEAAADARRASVRVAQADRLPSVSAFVQFGVLALPTSPAFPTRLGQTSTAFCPTGSPATRVCQNNGFFQDRSAGLTVSWPLFDGLRTRGAIELAEAQARTAELELAQTRERAAVEAATARAALRRAGTLASAQRQTVSEAQEAFRLAELRFARGLGTQLEVTDAQLALLTAQTNALRATFDVYLAAADLARATGQPIPLAGQTP